MLCIKTYLQPSAIHGIGLFAAESVLPGTRVYTQSPLLDVALSECELALLHQVDQCVVRHYGYLDVRSKLWRLAFDDMRFCNHSLAGNIGLLGEAVVALRFIRPGDELLQDYSEFEILRSGLI